MFRSFFIWILIFCKTIFVSSPDGTSSDHHHHTPSPESESQTSPAFSFDGQPEPRPKWSVAFKVWKWAWPFHVYTFGTCFLIVMLVSFAYLVFDCVAQRTVNNRLKVGLFVDIFLFCKTRGVLLLVDPYNSQGLAHEVPYFIFWSIGFPLILSAFSLLLLALVDTTRINLTPPRLQNLFTLTFLTVAHLLIVLAIDLTSMNFQVGKVLLLLCQIYLSLFGLILSLGFLYVAVKLTQNTGRLVDSKMKRLKCLVCLSSFLGIIFACMRIYFATTFSGVLSGGGISPWPWLAQQTCERSVEISMCFVILLVFKRMKYNKDNNAVADQS